jgi:hypothetical protein
VAIEWQGSRRGLVGVCHSRPRGVNVGSLGLRPLPIALKLGYHMRLRLGEADVTQVRARKHPRHYGCALVCCHSRKDFLVEERAVLIYLVAAFALRCIPSVQVYLLRPNVSVAN